MIYRAFVYHPPGQQHSFAFSAPLPPVRALAFDPMLFVDELKLVVVGGARSCVIRLGMGMKGDGR